ncbi:ROK family transcriptional regulator [Allonocardiopsis opalescens]|uniref:Putative NBD/HSP70 family sugar kinase n=1 Tax=Allonocardiopsis opalescens TaxID=1144618 RepID=A0A2T0PV92_9ACTN|nr:ROK family transcriptional regulator [Allonocardiopsis opalescens]PRX95455.1 putative NBD/HSP70 family sugar kinase [Allonocardiopsis opalescens]
MPQVSGVSAGHLLQYIRRGQARTRRDLMELTGLARSTVAQRVDQLVTAGYLREGGVDVSTGGRRPNVLHVDEDSAVVLAADIGATHGRLAVMDLGGRNLAESASPLSLRDGPEPVVRWMTERFAVLLDRVGRSVDEVCGVGVGVPGPVNPHTGRVMPTALMPEWPGFDLRAALGEAFPGPVLVDNDANVMALGEYTVADPDWSTLLLVKVGTAIGSGIVADGRLLHGVGGAAGEIGHVRVRGHDDVRCECGASGCLVAVAGGAALARRLGVGGTHAVVRLVAEGDPRAVRLTREAGQVLGEVLATVVSVVNPGTLIVSGALARTGEVLLGGVSEVIFQAAQHRSTHGLRIIQGRLAERAGVVGTVAMVVDRVLSAEAVDARLLGVEAESTLVRPA